MIGLLPKSLKVDNIDYAIRSDFRVALLIFEAYNDPVLSDYEKSVVCLRCLYKNVPVNEQEALHKAIWFLDGGSLAKDDKNNVKVMDWEQDENIIFPAINKVAGYEIREKKDIHWWTFLGFFNEIDEGLFTTVMSIRAKKAKRKKLEKHEIEYYQEHRNLIDLKIKYSEEEQKEIDRLNKLLG